MLLRILPGLVLLACGLFLLMVLIPLGLQDPGYVQPYSLSPGDLPKSFAYLIIAASAAMIVVGAMSGGQDIVSPGIIQPLRAIAFTAGMIAFLVLLPILGVTIGTFVFVGGLLLFTSDLAAWKSALAAFGFALTIQVVFIELARIPLPRGLLGLL